MCFKQGRILGGFGGLGPPGHQRGAKKKKGKGKERQRKKEKRGKEGNKERKKGKKRGQERKKDRKKVNQHDERGTMQFQAQASALGKKISGAPN